jgi:dTDP-4-dehydrorhamnose reductase
MRLLILGASGLVGHHLLCLGRSQGHETLGTSCRQRVVGLVPLCLDEEATWPMVVERFAPEALVCCSGWTWVDGCEEDPERAWRENVLQPARLAQVSTEIGARFVYFSTSYVFDGTEGPYGEDGIPRPLSVYGRSKLAGEQAVTAATAGRACIIRSMGVYGPEPQEKNFVYQVRRVLLQGQALLVPDDQFGNATRAEDLAAITLALLQLEASGIWNVAGPDPDLRRSDFARQVAHGYGLDAGLIQPVPSRQLGQKAARPRHGGLRIARIRELGFAPRPFQPF